jgi:phosphate transport system protein
MTTQRHVDEEYDQIRQMLLSMGGRVEEMVALATRALVERDTDVARQVIADDREVDAIEKRIDEECLSLLARQQPAARDLRFLVAVMKITNDLERIGDSAANISRSVLGLNNEPPADTGVDIPQLSKAVRTMVRESLDALVRRDSDLAMSVWRSDDAVDLLHKRMYRQLVQEMIEEPKRVSRALPLLHISRNLERIADHATNIAEDVIYYVEGKDIRHSATDYGDRTEEGMES